MSNITQNETKLYIHPIYNDYCCTLDGLIFSKKYNELKKLKPTISSNDYLQFNIRHNNKTIGKLVHQFVLEAFYGLIPNWSNKTGDGLTINHIDSNKLNNNFINLEIITHRENTKLRECDKIKNKKSALPLDVSLVKNRSKAFRVRIYHQGKLKSFGYYSSIEEAEQVAIKQRKLLFPNEK